MDLDPRCLGFIDHWKRARGSAPVPPVDAWTTLLPAHLAGSTFRAEILSVDARVLFMGSALIARRNDDNTGRSLYAYAPQNAARGLAMLQACVSRPCGYAFLSEHHTTERRILRAQSVLLPLAPPQGTPPQVVGYSVERDVRLPNERMLLGVKVIVQAWIDCGAGTPSDALLPERLVDAH